MNSCPKGIDLSYYLPKHFLLFICLILSFLSETNRYRGEIDLPLTDSFRKADPIARSQELHLSFPNGKAYTACSGDKPKADIVVEQLINEQEAAAGGLICNTKV